MTFPMQLGSKGDAVREIQRKLALNTSRQEFRAHQCDGFFGKETQEAVRAFQEKHGLAADGVCTEATWYKLNEEAGSVFSETWQYELEALTERVAPKDVHAVFDEAKLTAKVHAAQMAGLAFSGGGIRSATFNLGILQALAELKMLRDFHYLSTVSGGGYIGAWFSKWLKREKGNIDPVEKALAPTPGDDQPQRKEAEEIRFLRQYSNYLTAKTGFFSADTWSVLATYFRNTLLNLSILVALMAAVLILPRLLVLAVDKFHPVLATTMTWRGTPFSIAAIAAIGFALWAVFWIAVSISTLPDPAKRKWIRGQSQGSVISGIVLPLIVAAFAGSIALWDARAAIEQAWERMVATPSLDNPIAGWLVAPGIVYFVTWLMGWGLAKYYNREPSRKKPGARFPFRHAAPSLLREGVGHLLCAIGAFSAGTVLVVLTTSAIAGAGASGATRHVVAFGMPVLLGLFGITMVLSVGLVGRMYSERSREWWSRQGGWTMIFVIGWLGLVTVGLYGHDLVAALESLAGGWGGKLLGSAWFGTTVIGLLLGNSNATGKQRSPRVLEWIAVVAPYVFSIGALLGVSALLHRLTASIETSPQQLGFVLLGLVAFGVLLAWRVDINKFSLHMMYRNRLVRAYLGASNTQRQPHPFTGFDDCDDINVDELLTPDGDVQRPFHIMNTTLNLVNGQELAWQTRKAAGFTFTPAFCGFELPSMAAPGGAKTAAEAMRGSYRATSFYRRDRKFGDEDDGVKLGMAVTVSGAAASPNMGYHSSPALAFLMTLFNVRLGRWFANPLRSGPGRNSTSPKIGLSRLFAELFGLTDASANFVYLSDGGHFENLGVYELVRRRCRLIVVVDAGADCELNFDDLGNAIRKCATDLNVDIDIDARPVGMRENSEFSSAHCAVGTIHYDKTDRNAPPGTLLYIKPSLLGTECADLLNYRKSNASFPQDTTADQWFDETQFESYRALGYRIGKMVLEQAAAGAVGGKGPEHDIPTLCALLDEQWRKGPEERPALKAVG